MGLHCEKVFSTGALIAVTGDHVVMTKLPRLYCPNLEYATFCIVNLAMGAKLRVSC